MLPLLNVGFCNRRRFLARGNQSDKHGSARGAPNPAVLVGE